MQNADEYEVEHRRRHSIETDFEEVVVVWSDAETRHKAVDHQVDVLTDTILTARERLGRVEQQRLPQTTQAPDQCHGQISVNSKHVFNNLSTGCPLIFNTNFPSLFHDQNYGNL